MKWCDDLQLISQFEHALDENLWLQHAKFVLCEWFGVGSALFLNKFCLVAVILKAFLLTASLLKFLSNLLLLLVKFSFVAIKLAWFDDGERCLSRIAFPFMPFPKENENDDNVEQS